jgi:hypothetical protein
VKQNEVVVNKIERTQELGKLLELGIEMQQVEGEREEANKSQEKEPAENWGQANSMNKQWQKCRVFNRFK